MSTHPSRFSSSGTSSRKSSLTFHRCDSSTLVSFRGPIPCLPGVRATHSGSSLDRLLASEIRNRVLFTFRNSHCAKLRINTQHLLHLAAGYQPSLCSGFPGCLPIKGQAGHVRSKSPPAKLPELVPRASGRVRVTLGAPGSLAPRLPGPTFPGCGPEPGLRRVTWASRPASANAVAAQLLGPPLSRAQARRRKWRTRLLGPIALERAGPGERSQCIRTRNAGVSAAQSWWDT